MVNKDKVIHFFCIIDEFNKILMPNLIKNYESSFPVLANL